MWFGGDGGWVLMVNGFDGGASLEMVAISPSSLYLCYVSSFVF